ncbi:MAG: hypothetical protein L0G99_16130 [Propionibacteriales bacterium]|nr:hypothetical protein [Propionibacteriales bacterium]
MSNPYQQGQYPQGAPLGQDPGQTMGIIGLILAFVFAPAGLIVSHIAKKQSREAGFDNGLAKAGFIIGLIFTILGVLYVIAMIIIFVVAMSTAGA